MADVNDVLGVADRPDKELGKLLRQEYLENVDPDDGEAIRDALLALREGGLERGSKGWQAPNTQADRIAQLRRTAVRVNRNLLDYERPAHVREAIKVHEDNGVESQVGKSGYAAALTAFFKFLDREPGRGDFGWVAMYSPPKRDSDEQKVDPDDYPGESEIAAIRRGLSLQRDKVLVEVMVDFGLRRTASSQLRAGDVRLDPDSEPVPQLRVNPDGLAQKGAAGHDLTWIDVKDSEVHLRRWMREGHPEAPDPPDAAPLFPVSRGYDPENRSECAVHPRSVADQLANAAERAGIEDVDTNHHAFKHAAVKRFRWRYGMDWEAIRDRVLWSDDSLAEMMQIYGRLDVDERKERQREQMDIDADSDDDGEPSTVECAACGREIPPTANFCPGCGNDPTEAPGQKAGYSESEVRQIVRETVEDVLGVDADADLGERAEASAKAQAALAADDDRPDPDPFADLADDLDLDADEPADVQLPELPDADEPADAEVPWMQERRDG